jgi:hypothetical protein
VQDWLELLILCPLLLAGFLLGVSNSISKEKIMLKIEIEHTSAGLNIQLINKNRVYSEEILDQFIGDTNEAMKIVSDWMEQTEDLTTIKNI